MPSFYISLDAVLGVDVDDAEDDKEALDLVFQYLHELLDDKIYWAVTNAFVEATEEEGA